jgi:hypothetical protein
LPPKSPTPSPTPTPNTSPSIGASYVYTGTLTQTFARPPVAVSPLPSPNPAYTSTATASVSQTVSVLAATSPPCAAAGSATPQYNFHAVETDTFPTRAQSSTTDQYVAYVPAGSVTNVYQICSSSSASSGATYTTSYGSGNGLIDVQPEKTGALTPANSPALSRSEVDPDGQRTTRAVAADGTYVENTTYAVVDPVTSLTLTASATENLDGSAAVSLPLGGYAGTVASIQPPSGSSILVVLTYSSVIGAFETQVGQMLPSSFTPATWYPTPLALSKETFVDNGVQTLPSGCAVPSSLNKPANQLVQTITSVDTAYGETETSTRTSYNSTAGVLCMILSDVTTQYYDYTGQTNAGAVIAGFPFPIPAFSGTPLQTTTIAQTLALQSVAAASGAAKPASVLAAPVTSAFFAAVSEARKERHRLRIAAFAGGMRR